MENKKENLDSELDDFVAFIPNRLGLKAKPELDVFPFNVLIGRHTIRDSKNVLGTAIYEPDLSSLMMDEERNLMMDYRNRHDSRYLLKIIIAKDLKTRSCEKYREKEKIGEAGCPIDWERQDESWKKFFVQVALLGLDKGEQCKFI